DTEAASRGSLGGESRPVQVGSLNGRSFSVNASLGSYPQLSEDREAYKQRFGRSRSVALWSGSVTSSRAPRQLGSRSEYEGRVRDSRAPTSVVGNNRSQSEHIGIDPTESDRNRSVAMATRPVGTSASYGSLSRGSFSRSGDAEHVVNFAFDRSAVSIRGRRRVKVAMDGEISGMDGPSEFKVAETPSPLVVPVDAPDGARP
ncbi:hypothetical protein OY671_009021, partial [Metschnikowia pulcherrima]